MGLSRVRKWHETIGFHPSKEVVEHCNWERNREQSHPVSVQGVGKVCMEGMGWHMLTNTHGS